MFCQSHQSWLLLWKQSTLCFALCCFYHETKRLKITLPDSHVLKSVISENEISDIVFSKCKLSQDGRIRDQTCFSLNNGDALAIIFICNFSNRWLSTSCLAKPSSVCSEKACGNDISRWACQDGTNNIVRRPFAFSCMETISEKSNQGTLPEKILGILIRIECCYHTYTFGFMWARVYTEVAAVMSAI